MASFFCASRSWGSEYILYISPKYYTIKALFVKAGSKGGLQKHHFKDEVGFILDGYLRVYKGSSLDDLSEDTIGPGTFFSFPPGLIHQEEALVDTLILEISSPHLNDRVRYDNDTSNKLVSTEPKDVYYLADSTSIPEQLSKLGFVQMDASSLPVQLVNIVSFHL